MSLLLGSLSHCFHGVIPSVIATASADGTPNVTYVSHVYYIDEKHVALSCQFFNKTRQNVEENPLAAVELYDPLTFDAYRLKISYRRSETQGALFEQMRARLDAIASHTGMHGVFRLLSADIYEVLSVEPVAGFLTPLPEDAPPSLPDPHGPMTELRGLQIISSRINQAANLDELLNNTLSALEDAFAFDHSMLLLVDETGERLFTVASRGYGESGVGAEVTIGEGLIGIAAAQRQPARIVGMASDLRYGRAIRARARELGHTSTVAEVPLPGLPDAQSQLVLPLVVRERLLGVLAVESTHPLRFEHWHEAFLGVITNQVALALERMTSSEEVEPERARAAVAALAAPAVAPPLASELAAHESSTALKVPRPAPIELRGGAANAEKHTFWFFPNDDCVFVDGEYLVRNTPGKILWKLLQDFAHQGRREFSNRELRLDQSLGLPALKDNLESRLILLRRRLQDKCPSVKLIPIKRGRFALEVDGPLELVERKGVA
ncbi:MAG TPA: GAF domain-containing protein [Polyangiaceae bacterium]|nr:GAF domain-containing protein [Polyangiaceae bacterium]